MTKTLAKPLVCVVGPTASGKTAVAQKLAESLNGAVLSADSMQVYRGMDIGTGKIPVCERTVDYYGLDLVDPGSAYSASLFQSYGRSVVESLDERGLACVLCGGTGFYVRAVVDDFQFPSGEQVDNPVRERFNALLAQRGAFAVWQELHALDPESARIIPVNDSKRVIRALEMHDEGLSYAVQKAKFSTIAPYYEPLRIFGLSVDPDVLVDRIDKRVDDMVGQGLIDEVHDLLERGYRHAVTANQAIGYKEIVAAEEGACTKDEAIAQIKLATRQYAKRQRTWFRKDKRIVWMEATNASAEEVAFKIGELLVQDTGDSQ